MLDATLWRVARLGLRNKRIGAAADPFLLRVYLFQLSNGAGICLHRIYRSDDANALHNHPRAWGVGIPLTRGYREHRRYIDANGCVCVRTRHVGVGRLNWIGRDTFHRIELDRGPCWTLFIAGPRVRGWGFMEADGKFTDAKDAPGSRMLQTRNVEVTR